MLFFLGSVLTAFCSSVGAAGVEKSLVRSYGQEDAFFGYCYANSDATLQDCCEAIRSTVPDTAYHACLQKGTVLDLETTLIKELPRFFFWYPGNESARGRDLSEPNVYQAAFNVGEQFESSNSTLLKTVLSESGGMHREMQHTVDVDALDTPYYYMILLVPPDLFVNVEDTFRYQNCHVELLTSPLIDQEVPVFLYSQSHVLLIQSDCRAFSTKLHLRYPVPTHVGHHSILFPAPEIVGEHASNVPMLIWEAATGYSQDYVIVTLVSVVVSLVGAMAMYRDISRIAQF